ncbi:MAG: hypothetical protein K2K51_06280, partial [Bacteroidales bacterium]|nr:hypothetical protein [Bacteroidales bacterium]
RTDNGFGNKATVISENALTNSETATMQRTNVGFGNKATVIPEYDGAKVVRNLDIAKSVYAKRSNNTKGFITDIARALGLKRHGSSQYGTFITPSGKTFTLRISNHNAKVGNFDKHGEVEGISVVVSSYSNKGLRNEGQAHVTEFFYRRTDINFSKDKPLVEILGSLQKMLQTGEYVDTTGLAHVEEVNKRITPDQSSLLRHPNYAQYPTNQGLSEDKGTLLLEEKQAEWIPAYFTTTLHRLPSATTRRT